MGWLCKGIAVALWIHDSLKHFVHSVLVYLLNLKYYSGLFMHFSMILEVFSGFKSVGGSRWYISIQKFTGERKNKQKCYE